MNATKWTPGPWDWFGNAHGRHLYLATPDRGRLYVMGFERWGFYGAQPVFRDATGRMRPASDFLKFEIGDRNVVGIDAARSDPSVYRYDVRGIDHPDARLIAEAPAMAEALRALVAWKSAIDTLAPELGGLLVSIYQAEALLARLEGRE